MEFLIFALILLGIIVLILFFQFINSRRDDKLYLLDLKNGFGKPQSRSSYDHDRLITADAYLKRHMTADCLDDITRADLSMNEIYKAVDTTQSDAGRYVLFYDLNCPLKDVSEIEKRRRLIEFWQNDPGLCSEINLILHRAGGMEKHSVYDHLDSVRDIPALKTRSYYIKIAALILAFVSIYPLRGFGVILFIAVLISNLYAYYRDKTKTSVYIKVFDHILKLADSSMQIIRCLKKHENVCSEAEELVSAVDETLSSLKSVRKKGHLLKMSEAGYDPFIGVLNMLGAFVYADLFRFERLKNEMGDHYDDIDRLIWLTGSIDATIAMAGYITSMNGSCCRAELTSGSIIKADGLVHPLIDGAVPNSVTIDRNMLITGANASGKSTFLRSVAIATVYAQTFGYVCANEYKAPVISLMSAMNVTDDIVSGDSYYMAEIKAVKRMTDSVPGEADILRLCLVDELLNGTNTQERIAAGTQILDHMSHMGIRVLAATHDNELTYLLNDDYENYHFEEDLSEGDVKFSYRIMPGRAQSSNAIRLLDELGFDSSIVDKASQMVAIHSQTGEWKKV